jgi:hypothetical protein
MRTILISITLLTVTTAWAADQKAKSLPPAEQYLAIIKEFSKKEQDLDKTFRETKDPKARDGIIEQYKALVRTSASQCLQLAEKNPNDSAAVDALLWIADKSPVTASMPAGLEFNKALEILATKYPQSHKMGQLCEELAGKPAAAVGQLLRAVLEKNPKRDIQGIACLSLGQYLSSLSADIAHKAQAAQLQNEAQKYLEMAINKYGDVKLAQETIGDRAKSDLYELLHLAVGKLAPELVGQDSDNKDFKLQDYRGKVVVLDFWARW